MRQTGVVTSGEDRIAQSLYGVIASVESKPIDDKGESIRLTEIGELVRAAQCPFAITRIGFPIHGEEGKKERGDDAPGLFGTRMRRRGRIMR